MTIIRFRRGNKANLPELAPSGMPLWCEDTKELYLGTGDDVHLIGSSNTNSAGGNLTPYSVNYGNYDADGYADLIEKVSDTEVAFKIGGVYPNMGVTFPNGNHYEISSIQNITGLNDNTIYTFIIFEENLAELEDGTFFATATPFKLNYPYINYMEDNLLSGFTSNTKDGITLSASHSSSSAYLAADDNDSSKWPGAGHRTLCGNPYPFVPGSGGAVNFYVNFDTPRKLWKVQILQGYTWSANGKLYISEDNGATWIEVGGINGGNGSFFTKEFKNFSQYNVNKVWFNFTGGTAWHSAGGDCGTCGMDTYTIKLFEAEELELPGGNLTEDLILPEAPANGDLALLINQNPLKPYIRQNDAWIEKQFVKIGQVQKLSDLLGTPISYAFNGYNISPLIDIPVATRQIIEHNHNIGSYCFGDAELVCIATSGGYSEDETLTEFYARTPDNNFAINRPYFKNNFVVRHGTWHISNGLFTSVTKDYKSTLEILATKFKIRFITKRGF